MKDQLYCTICLISLGLSAYGVAESNLAKPNHKNDFQVNGLGEISFEYHNYPENEYRDRTTGPQKHNRFLSEISRMSLNLKKSFPNNSQFIGMILGEGYGYREKNRPVFSEATNQSTGGHRSSGSIVLNQFYLTKRFRPDWSIYIGKIPVALSITTHASGNPLTYSGTHPFRTEALLPPNWSELGLGFTYNSGHWRWKSQIISGLDSTGFSSRWWIAGGSQGRYNHIKFNSPALVQRIDYKTILGYLGASLYYGNTSQNRPTPDLAEECEEALTPGENIGECGYQEGAVTITDIHAQFRFRQAILRILALYGQLTNADGINAKNQRNIANLPQNYSPVSSSAFGFAFEGGLKLRLKNTHSFIPFVRFERFHSLAKSPEGYGADPTLDRRVFTAGFDLNITSYLYVKFDLNRRSFAVAELYDSSRFNEGIELYPEDFVQSTFGLRF